MSRFFDLLVANEVYADIDFIMSPTTDGKTESFYLAGTLTSLTVDWGDGTQTTAQETNSHTYTSAGDYRVRVLGDCRAVTRFRCATNVWDTNKYYDVTLVNNINLPNATSLQYAFFRCTRLRKIIKLHCPKVIDASCAFAFCSFTTFPSVRWLLLNNSVNIFYGCSRLVSFSSDSKIGFKYGSGFNFCECYSLTHLPDGFDFSNSTVLQNCFFDCVSLTSLPAGVTFSNLINAVYAFKNCSSLVWTPQASDFWERQSPQVAYNGQTFQGCTSMPNYASIPTAWKDGGNTVLYQPPNS